MAGNDDFLVTHQPIEQFPEPGLCLKRSHTCHCGWVTESASQRGRWTNGKPLMIGRLGDGRFRQVEVGTRVAPRPPHRSRRAVFLHRALQINSLSHPLANAVARNGVPWELKTDGEGLGWGRDSDFTGEARA
jgi:hypothetical protein